MKKRHENQKKKLELEFAEMDQKRREFERERAEFDEQARVLTIKFSTFLKLRHFDKKNRKKVRLWEAKSASSSDKKKKQNKGLFWLLGNATNHYHTLLLKQKKTGTLYKQRHCQLKQKSSEKY